MSSSPAQTLGELSDLLQKVPDFERFLPVDELIAESVDIAAGSPSRVAWRRIGSSRLGEPIHELVIGSGPLHALVFAGIHPNEPIGCLTALHLARSLAGDREMTERLGYTWHVIPCIDPDGMRLNESWFGGQMTRESYARGFYRPPGNEQVEWTFPFAYKDIYFDKVLPETLALMRVIDEVRPTFMCSLHNGELGGVYYYLSHEAPPLYRALSAIPAFFGLPLDTGGPEAPFAPVLSPGIYQEIRMEDAYEYAVSLGTDPTTVVDAGDSSNSYCRKYGTFTLVSEVPYWMHRDASDQSASARSFDSVLRERSQGSGEVAAFLLDVLDRTAPDRVINSPFLRATRSFAGWLTSISERDAKRALAPENSRPATVAEAFAGADLVHFLRLRYGGMLLRTLEAEVTAGNGTPAIRRELGRAQRHYQGWCDEALAVTPAETVPLRSLVGVQYGAILASAEYAATAASAQAPDAPAGRSAPAGVVT